MEYILIEDTAILAVNCGRQENEASHLVYRDKEGILHSVDFAVCAANFKAQHQSSSGNGIGERNMEAGYFVFYTSGIKTKVIFQKAYVSKLFRHHLLRGSKAARFMSLQTWIAKTKYTTYDIS